MQCCQSCLLFGASMYKSVYFPKFVDKFWLFEQQIWDLLKTKDVVTLATLYAERSTTKWCNLHSLLFIYYDPNV